MTYDAEKLKAELVRDEAKRRWLYVCPAGFITGGIGHNFEAKPLSEAAIELFYREDVADAEADLDVLIPRWRALDDGRQRVLVNMSLQLGRKGLGSFWRFRATIPMVLDAPDQTARDQALAAGVVEMLDSRWADQTPARAQRLAGRWGP